MQRTYINGRFYVQISVILMAIIFVTPVLILIGPAFEKKISVNAFTAISTLGFVISFLIGKSKFLYKTLERTDNLHISIYNNFFGKKLNKTSISIADIECLDTSQDKNNYFILTLKIKDQESIKLGKFAVKSHLNQKKTVLEQIVKK